MSNTLIIVISVLISLLIFALEHFLFRKKWYLSLILTLFSLLALFFIWDLQFTLKLKKTAYPPLYALIDTSLSQGTNQSYFDQLATIVPPGRIYSFPEKGNQSSTALHDEILTVLDSIEDQSRLVVISDFRDNSSYNPVLYNDRVIPLIYEDHHNDQGALVHLDYQEQLQAGQKNQWQITLYSHEKKRARLLVSDKKTVLQDIALNLTAGLNEKTVQFKLNEEGYHSLKFRLIDPSDPWTNNNEIQVLVNALPSRYHILLIAGRPSTELATFQRFIQGLHWIGLESEVLLRKGEQYTIPSPAQLQKNDAIIIMDIKDSQISGLERLAAFEGKMLYIPGIHDHTGIRHLLDLFEVPLLPQKIQEIKIPLGNEKQVIQTAFQSKEYLLKKRNFVFLGWDTWKWDFGMLAYNLQLNHYPVFWKNILIQLIGQDNLALFQDRLNYSPDENNPLQINTPGIYQYYTNKLTLQFMVQAPWSELALLRADRESAAGFNTNVFTIGPNLDWAGLARSLRPVHKAVWIKEKTFGFRHNTWVLAFMAFLISLYWFLNDRNILKS